ncbi:SPOR domain-containing protein, partial [Pseudomonas sp. CrR7]|nr:SPOR domain-containing protein [Pseudomonas sp. CM27]
QARRDEVMAKLGTDSVVIQHGVAR